MAVPGGMTPAAAAVRAAVAELAPGPLVVALSGGADSAVAAWACAAGRPAASVRAVHIDHGWPAAPLLRRAASDLADLLQLPLDTISVTIPPGASPEATARAARLEALETAARGTRIVTGHHADDVAETVIGNLLRGAGLTGLSGIAPVRLPFVRPLLAFRRSELRQIATALQLPFCDDPSNEDTDLQRNAIRLEVIPKLNAHIAGDVVELLTRSAGLLGAADAYLEEITPGDGVIRTSGVTLVAVAPLLTMAPVLAERVVRRALRSARPPYPGSSREVAAVLEVAAGAAARHDLGGGLEVAREGPFVAIYRPATEASPASPVALRWPGVVEFGSHRLTATPVADGRRAHLSNDWCRLALEDEQVVIRSANPGDRVDLGEGSKLVSDALGEAAIPIRKRPAWPLVESRGRIAWVAGVRVASWARKKTAATRWIQLERRDA